MGAPADDHYEQLVTAGLVRPAHRPFDLANLPEPAPNPTARDSGDWLTELRGER
jgi:hypothetical protein